MSYLGVTFNSIYLNLQLEEGDTATSYEPYYEPRITTIMLAEPLRKVGDVADYIDLKTCEVVRKVGAYTFTGEENWSLAWSREGCFLYSDLNNLYQPLFYHLHFLQKYYHVNSFHTC